jgi:hypothetical protein
MNHSSAELQLSIQQSLQNIAVQMGHQLKPSAAAQIYQTASELLSQIAYEPLTLARVAGTLLVYQLQQVEPEEVAWFKEQVQQCPTDEDVEEIIESIHRTDAL